MALNFKAKAADAFNKFKTDLALNPQQTTDVSKLLNEFYEKGAVVRQQFKGDKATMKQNIKPIRQELRSKLKTVLTPQQIETYKQHKGEYAAIFKSKAAEVKSNS